MRAKEDALAAETAQIKSVLADLKGTEFAYNHKGEIVMLETVKVERLPSQDVHLRVGLWSKSQSGEEEAPGRPARKGGRPTRGGKAAGKSKKEDAGVMGSVGMARPPPPPPAAWRRPYSVALPMQPPRDSSPGEFWG